MNLRIKIEITKADTDEVLWTDRVSGDSEYQRGMFESAEMSLGKMERHLPKALEEDARRFHDLGDFDEDHDDQMAAAEDEHWSIRELPSDEGIDPIALSASQ